MLEEDLGTILRKRDKKWKGTYKNQETLIVGSTAKILGTPGNCTTATMIDINIWGS